MASQISSDSRIVTPGLRIVTPRMDFVLTNYQLGRFRAGAHSVPHRRDLVAIAVASNALKRLTKAKGDEFTLHRMVPNSDDAKGPGLVLTPTVLVGGTLVSNSNCRTFCLKCDFFSPCILTGYECWRSNSRAVWSTTPPLSSHWPRNLEDLTITCLPSMTIAWLCLWILPAIAFKCLAVCFMLPTNNKKVWFFLQ